MRTIPTSRNIRHAGVRHASLFVCAAVAMLIAQVGGCSPKGAGANESNGTSSTGTEQSSTASNTQPSTPTETTADVTPASDAQEIPVIRQGGENAPAETATADSGSTPTDTNVADRAAALAEAARAGTTTSNSNSSSTPTTTSSKPSLSSPAGFIRDVISTTEVFAISNHAPAEALEPLAEFLASLETPELLPEQATALRQLVGGLAADGYAVSFGRSRVLVPPGGTSTATFDPRQIEGEDAVPGLAISVRPLVTGDRKSPDVNPRHTLTALPEPDDAAGTGYEIVETGGRLATPEALASAKTQPIPAERTLLAHVVAAPVFGGTPTDLLVLITPEVVAGGVNK